MPHNPYQPTHMGMWDLGASQIPPQQTWGLYTPQYPKHSRNQRVCGIRTAHHKLNSWEYILWYTQHQTIDLNITANLH